MNEIVLEILNKRGIKTESEIEEFLSDNPKKTYSPFFFNDMFKAVFKLLNAFLKGEKILIYADYDVDGITASTLLYKFFSIFTSSENLNIFIPSRFESGYGMNINDLKKILEAKINKPDLIISVDLGITCKDEVELIKEKGVDVIVTDHHEPPNLTPECIKIDPKVKEEEYPFKEICGCSVAFKVCQAITAFLKCIEKDEKSEIENIIKELNPKKTEVSIDEIHSFLSENNLTSLLDESSEFLKKVSFSEIKKTLDSLIDLVGVGTVCDIMPLIDENRTFIKYAFKKISTGVNLPLRELARASNFDIKNVNTHALGFIIGPKLNAVGRLETASKASKLLLSNDKNEITKLSYELTNLNEKRKDIQNKIFNSVLDEAVTRASNKEPILLLEAKEESEELKNVDFELAEGIIGIVASKIKERFHLPVIIFAFNKENYFLKGSSRSIESIDIISVLREAGEIYKNKNNNDLFLALGGHKMAAGLSIKKENLEALREVLIEIINKEIKKNKDLLKYIPKFDSIIKATKVEEKLTLELAKELECLAPFGAMNQKPVFKIPKLKIPEVILMGANKNHLRFKIGEITFVKFGFKESEVEILNNGIADIYGSLSVNEFNNQENVQFIIETAV